MEAGIFIVCRGLVQGVGFRYFVARSARELGLRGYVKNLPNGNVEIIAVGEKGLLESFLKEVRVGPRSARVADVKIEWMEGGSAYNEFEIR